MFIRRHNVIKLKLTLYSKWMLIINYVSHRNPFSGPWGANHETSCGTGQHDSAQNKNEFLSFFFVFRNRYLSLLLSDAHCFACRVILTFTVVFEFEKLPQHGVWTFFSSTVCQVSSRIPSLVFTFTAFLSRWVGDASVFTTLCREPLCWVFIFSRCELGLGVSWSLGSGLV